MKKEKIVGVRMTYDLYDFISIIAKAKGMKPSEYMRNVSVEQAQKCHKKYGVKKVWSQR